MGGSRPCTCAGHRPHSSSRPLALAISLGGTAWAAVRITSSAQLANGVVAVAEARHRLRRRPRPRRQRGEAPIDVAPRAITGDRLADGTVTSRQLANGAVDARKLAQPDLLRRRRELPARARHGRQRGHALHAVEPHDRALRRGRLDVRPARERLGDRDDAAVPGRRDPLPLLRPRRPGDRGHEGRARRRRRPLLTLLVIC